MLCLRYIFLLPLFALASCASHDKPDKSETPETSKTPKKASEQDKTNKTFKAGVAATEGRKSMSEKFYGPPIRQNAKGEWPDDTRKVSGFESNRKSPYFTEKSTVAKPYKTGEYAKSSMWAKKEVKKPSYTGNTDGSRFQTASNLKSSAAHEASTNARLPSSYNTGTYNTHAAHETSAKRFDKPSNAKTDQRRRVFPQPDIIDWKQQRAMDMKTTKTLLGRD